jgi:CubicO group peptidase (beta-lactamase class C family)
MDRAIESAHAGGFEGSVLVALGGNEVYAHSVGFGDEDETEELTADTRYGIASITKLFTAIAILQMVDEGRLSLAASLGEVLPDLDLPYADRITLHHLLLHISGLPNEPDALYLRSVDAREFVAAARPGTSRPPGDFNYANLDYVLLGMVLERVDGAPWTDVLRSRILDPLGMGDTGFLRRDAPPDRYAETFSIRGGDRRPDPPIFRESYGAAGSMYSTVRDLLKLDRAMYRDDFLSPEMRAAMYTSYPEYNYSGYSVWTYRYPFLDPAPLIMERRGGILGANTLLVRFLELDRTLIVLSNTDAFDTDSFGNPESLKDSLIMTVAQLEAR